MCGFSVVPVACDANGNIDVADLTAKAAAHAHDLAALMVTYPSTHGVFETSINDICATIHAHGGQVYMDGANMNAQVGLTSPGHIGADVCHLNLHKTFCIPHGGGGPGMGPIGVAAHLVPFLPGHQVVAPAGTQKAAIGAVSRRAVWLRQHPRHLLDVYPHDGPRRPHAQRRKHAILNANYMAKRLREILPRALHAATPASSPTSASSISAPGRSTGIEVEDAAKRLMDYGYHAPTMSFPVPGTLMIEPTESEAQSELDRFCDALISIHGEMQAVVNGESDKANNPLKHAPHTAKVVCGDEWDPPLLARVGRLPERLRPPRQILAERRPRGQRLRRPQPRLLLHRHGSLRGSQSLNPTGSRSLLPQKATHLRLQRT